MLKSAQTYLKNLAMFNIFQHYEWMGYSVENNWRLKRSLTLKVPTPQNGQTPKNFVRIVYLIDSDHFVGSSLKGLISTKTFSNPVIMTF